MTLLKKIFIAILGSALFISAPISAVSSASIPDEQWNLPMNAPGQDGAELIGIKFAGSFTDMDSPSYIAGDSTGQGRSSDSLLCTSASDPICKSAVYVNYQAFLPVCDASIQINCITSVSAIGSDGREISGTYKKDFPLKTASDYPGDPSRNLPVGAHPSVWTIPGITNGGGADTYLLRFKLKGTASPNSKFNTNSIEVSLYPTSEKTGDYSIGKMTDTNHPSTGCLMNHIGCGGLGGEHAGNSDGLSSACVSFDVGQCALRQAFPDGYRFKVSARLGDSPTGWFHGRFFNPQIALTSTAGATELVVDATPVKVPAVGIYIKQSEMSPAMKTFYSQFPPGTSFGNLSANGIANLLDSPGPSEPRVFDQFAMWSSYFKDTASATQSEWSFRTLQLNGNDGACLGDNTKLIGVVSTNAMIYSGGAPAFNASEGSLDYKVGAPHYASNGDVFKGSYDLQLRSDVARCLYKFSSAPIKATISVANSNGDANVATTIFTEDKATGWVRMSASNFLFSSPTVKIKLTQDAPAPAVTPTPVATPEPTPSASPMPIATSASVVVPVPVAKKITITCVKGKTTKSVTAVKPVCPIGYKKK